MAAFKIYQDLNITTAPQIFEAQSAAIGLLSKDSPEKTSALLELMIIDLQSFVNVNRPMNEMQIRETARLLMQRYNYMKIEDCKLVFDRIKTGHIKLYEGLDGQKILMAFEGWAEERWQSADHYNYNKHISATSHTKQNRDKPFLIGDPDAPSHDKIVEYMKSVAKNLDNHQVKP